MSNMFDPIQLHEPEIQTYAWQKSTIAERSLGCESVLVVISPSQFRPLMSSPSTAVSFALATLRYAREQVPTSRSIVLIADQIQQYSISVFEHKNDQRARETATAQGHKLREIFTLACQELCPADAQMIDIIQWNDIAIFGGYNACVDHVRDYVNRVDLPASRLIDEVMQRDRST